MKRMWAYFFCNTDSDFSRTRRGRVMIERTMLLLLDAAKPVAITHVVQLLQRLGLNDFLRQSDPKKRNNRTQL